MTTAGEYCMTADKKVRGARDIHHSECNRHPNWPHQQGSSAYNT